MVAVSVGSPAFARLRTLLVSLSLLLPSACAHPGDREAPPLGTENPSIDMGGYEIVGVQVRPDHLAYLTAEDERILVRLRAPGVLSAESSAFRFDLDFVTGDVLEAALEDGRITGSLHVSRRPEPSGGVHERYRFHDGATRSLNRREGIDAPSSERRLWDWYLPRAERAGLLNNAGGERLMQFLNAPAFHRSLLNGLGAQLSTEWTAVDPELLEQITRHLRRAKEDDPITESVCDLLAICAAVKCTLGGGPANPGCDACIGGTIGCHLGRLLNRVFDAIFGDGRGRRPGGESWRFAPDRK